MASLKEIKTRIGSVKNTLKITSAMKLVSSAKLHKAQMAIEGMLPYSQRLEAMLQDIKLSEKFNVQGSKEQDILLPSLERGRGESPQKTIALVAISSSTSLCGAFNHNLIRLTQQVISEYQSQGHRVLLIPIGRKVAQAVSATSDEPRATSDHTGKDISLITDYVTIGEKPTYAQAAALSAHLTTLYQSGQVQRVEFLYTHYKNIAVQVLTRNQFLPLEDKIQDSKLVRASSHQATQVNVQGSMEGVGLRLIQHDKMVEGVDTFSNEVKGEQVVSTPLPCGGAGGRVQQRGGSLEYILEPTPRELIRTLYPRVLAVRLFATLLDSSAAEHAARSFAMQQATDNGEMLLQELNLQYNKVRQQSITNELLDIVGGTMR